MGLVLAGLLSFACAANAQTEMLEMPRKTSDTNNNKRVQNSGLELLSADEIRTLYKIEESPPNAAIKNDALGINNAQPNPLGIEPAMPAPQIGNIPSEIQDTNLLATEETLYREPSQMDNAVSAEEIRQDNFEEELSSDSAVPAKGDVDINKIWSFKSVMLQPREVRIFNAALSRYQRSVAGLAPVANDEIVIESDLQETFVNYPFITVDSIMYITPTNWAVWINKKRYSPSKTEALVGLKLISVSKNEATVEWTKPESSLELNQEIQIDGNFDEAEANLSDDIMVEDSNTVNDLDNGPLPANVMQLNNNTYRIRLSPNQAFITDDFSTQEGRVATLKIQEILSRYERKKQAEIAALAKESNVESTDTSSLDPEDLKAQQDIDTLLELYQNSNTPAN